MLYLNATLNQNFEVFSEGLSEICGFEKTSVYIFIYTLKLFSLSHVYIITFFFCFVLKSRMMKVELMSMQRKCGEKIGRSLIELLNVLFVSL